MRPLTLQELYEKIGELLGDKAEEVDPNTDIQLATADGEPITGVKLLFYGQGGGFVAFLQTEE